MHACMDCVSYLISILYIVQKMLENVNKSGNDYGTLTVLNGTGMVTHAVLLRYWSGISKVHSDLEGT